MPKVDREELDQFVARVKFVLVLFVRLSWIL